MECRELITILKFNSNDDIKNIILKTTHNKYKITIYDLAMIIDCYSFDKHKIEAIKIIKPKIVFDCSIICYLHHILAKIHNKMDRTHVLNLFIDNITLVVGHLLKSTLNNLLDIKNKIQIANIFNRYPTTNQNRSIIISFFIDLIQKEKNELIRIASFLSEYRINIFTMINDMLESIDYVFDSIVKILDAMTHDVTVIKIIAV